MAIIQWSFLSNLIVRAGRSLEYLPNFLAIHYDTKPTVAYRRNNKGREKMVLWLPFKFGSIDGII